MKVNELAEQLRKRQCELALVPAELIMHDFLELCSDSSAGDHIHMGTLQ